MKSLYVSIAVVCVAWASGGIAAAQSASAPTILRVDGELKTATGTPRTGNVLLVASLYEGSTDSTPLWIEQQLFTLDDLGHYTMFVGATQDDGVPKEYFLSGSSGSAHWLGIAVQGEPEHSRIMLVSVPYALKSREADTLAGKTTTDFVLAADLTDSVKSVLNEATVQFSGSNIAVTQNQATNPVGLNGHLRVGRGKAVVTRNQFDTGDHILIGSNLSVTDDTAVGDGGFVTTIRGPWVTLPGSPDGPGGRPYLVFGNLDGSHPVLTTNGPALQVERADRSGILAPFSASTISAGNISSSGAVSAVSFTGSGAGLTNLPAARLTGTLPAMASFAAVPDPEFGGGIGIAVTENATDNPVGLHGYIRIGRGQGVVTRNQSNTGDHILLGANLSVTDDTAIGDGDYVTSIRGAWVTVQGSPVGPGGRPYLVFGNLDDGHPVLTTNGTALQVELADRSGVLAPFIASTITAGDMNSSGAVSAASFTGSGAGLTNLPAANLTGTIPAGTLGSNVAALSATQTFSGANVFTNPTNSYTGNGAGLTGLTQILAAGAGAGCDAGHTGNMFYNTSTTSLQYCDGTAWRDVAPKRESIQATAAIAGASCWGGSTSDFVSPGLSATYTSNGRALLLSVYVANTSLNSSSPGTMIFRVVDGSGAELGATNVSYASGQSKPVSFTFPYRGYAADGTTLIRLECSSDQSTATIGNGEVRLLVSEQ